MSSELSISTRASLIEAIKDANDHRSWTEFTRAYTGLIRRLALSASLNKEEAEEVVQEVLISVARNIPSFSYDPSVSSFKSWLSNITRWRIISQRRKRWRERPFVRDECDDTHATGLLERIPAPAAAFESELDSNWAQEILRIALDRVKKRVKEKQYQIYYLYVLKREEMSEVCRLLKVNRARVYLAKFRVGKMVEEELMTLAKQADPANPPSH